MQVPLLACEKPVVRHVIQPATSPTARTCRSCSGLWLEQAAASERSSGGPAVAAFYFEPVTRCDTPTVVDNEPALRRMRPLWWLIVVALMLIAPSAPIWRRLLFGVIAFLGLEATLYLRTRLSPPGGWEITSVGDVARERGMAVVAGLPMLFVLTVGLAILLA